MQIVDTTPVAAMERGEKGSWALMLDPGETLTSEELLITLIDDLELSTEEADSVEGHLLSALEEIRAKKRAA